MSKLVESGIYENQEIIDNHLQSEKMDENQSCNVIYTRKKPQEHNSCSSSVFYDDGDDDAKHNNSYENQESINNLLQSDTIAENQNCDEIYSRKKLREHDSCIGSSSSSVFYENDDTIHNRLTLLSGISGSCVCESVSSDSDSESGICSILGRLIGSFRHSARNSKYMYMY